MSSNVLLCAFNYPSVNMSPDSNTGGTIEDMLHVHTPTHPDTHTPLYIFDFDFWLLYCKTPLCFFQISSLWFSNLQPLTLVVLLLDTFHGGQSRGSWVWGAAPGSDLRELSFYPTRILPNCPNLHLCAKIMLKPTEKNRRFDVWMNVQWHVLRN